jgi:hypothetical protein
MARAYRSVFVFAVLLGAAPAIAFDNPKGAIHFVERGRLVGEAVEVAGCSDVNYCIGIARVRITGLTATLTAPGYAAVWGKGVRLSGATITGARVGLRDVAGPKLVDSVLTGNDVDILAARRPRLVDSTCETSEDPLGTPWDVCTND